MTRDFLRAFSRALLREKDQDVAGDTLEGPRQVHPETTELGSIINGPPIIPADSATSSRIPSAVHLDSPLIFDDKHDYDYSLPLPADDAMQSPAQSVVQESAKPFKSYLERILEARKRPFPVFESDLESGPDSIHAIINTSKFVIENTISGLPDFHTLEASDLRLAEPLAFGNLSDHQTSDESSGKENHVPEFRPRVSEPNKTPEYNFLEPTAELGGEFIPTFADLNNDMDNDSDLSNGIVLGHFTIDNDNIADDFGASPLGTQPGNFLDSPKDPPLVPVKAPPRMIPSSKRPRGDRSAIPRSLVKGLVSLVRHIPKQSPPRKRSRNERLPPELIQVITAKSNELLQQVLSDLEAYAGHRGSKQINIQDAILYLNRIKSTSGSTSEIENISKLAQTVFPLELLVSLDNSLQESANKRLRQKPVDDEDYEDEISDDAVKEQAFDSDLDSNIEPPFESDAENIGAEFDPDNANDEDYDE